MNKDSNDRWADVCWWYGFKAGWGAAMIFDVLTGLAAWACYRWFWWP